jgi:hypothetical protein
MNEDDFLLDDEEDLEDQEYVTPEEDVDEEGDFESESDEEKESSPQLTEEDYGGKMTKDEIWLSSAYDDIMAASKKEDRVSMGGGRAFPSNIVDAVRTIIAASPKNTAQMTVENYTKELFQTQGHNRIPASIYAPDQPLRSGDLDDEFGITGIGAGEFNRSLVGINAPDLNAVFIIDLLVIAGAFIGLIHFSRQIAIAFFM